MKGNLIIRIEMVILSNTKIIDEIKRTKGRLEFLSGLLFIHICKL